MITSAPGRAVAWLEAQTGFAEVCGCGPESGGGAGLPPRSAAVSHLEATRPMSLGSP